MVHAHFYLTPAGRSPVIDYCRTLDEKQRQVLGSRLRSVQDNGLANAGVKVETIDGKLFELKVGYHRVFCATAKGGIVWFLHAYQKDTQQAPPAEIAIARARMAEVLAK